MKKVLIIISSIMGMFLCYELYCLFENYNNVKLLKNEINKRKEVDNEYIELLDSITSEVGSFEKIENKVGLLERTFSQNEELLGLLENDLSNLQIQNNNVENMIIQIEEEIAAKKNRVIINGNFVYSQFPKYPTGCESVALYLLLKYNGVDVTVDGIVDKIKKGELPYELSGKVYGGNPEIEFIGDPRDNYSYGVYNKPLQDVANIYKNNINSEIGLEFNKVLELVKNNRPVLVWVSINLSKPYISKTWTYKETGETINWIRGEHALVIIGYSDDQVIVSDPYTGTIRYFDRDLFKSRYDYFGKRALYY